MMTVFFAAEVAMFINAALPSFTATLTMVEKLSERAIPCTVRFHRVVVPRGLVFRGIRRLKPVKRANSSKLGLSRLWNFLFNRLKQ